MPIPSQEGTHAPFFISSSVSDIDLRGIMTEIKFQPTDLISSLLNFTIW